MTSHQIYLVQEIIIGICLGNSCHMSHKAITTGNLLKQIENNYNLYNMHGAVYN